MDKQDTSIAENILELLNQSKSVEEVLQLVKEKYCLRCGDKRSQTDCGCDYDSPLE